ncbi:MAG: hypothetical protein NC338_04960 [Firmicutes bacterium]|nr:hypothetical protein [Bacillota bacterium]MCM1400666.1 hypothetical protein [Bacteroides sp.]MCM1476360.1 hypothetical protein [Bacteroides sp.]
MKTFLQIILAFAIMAVPVTMQARNEDGSYTKKEMQRFEKEAQKQAKNMAKELKKEGWKLNGSGDLQLMIEKHLLKLADFGGNGTEYVGNANDIKNLNSASRMARMAASTAYAEQSQMALKERIDGSDVILDADQRQTLIAGYEARVAKELNGEITKSIELYKKNKNGTYDVRAFYVVDEEAARATKLRALRAEAEYMKLSTDIANQISKFVNE